MTRYTATCTECSQQYHAWAERPPCRCPDCVATVAMCSHEARELGAVPPVGMLYFEEDE